MKHLFHTLKLLSLALGVSTLSGCFTVTREGGPLLNEKCISSQTTMQVSSERITAVRPVLSLSGSTYTLCLEAEGDFVRHFETRSTYEQSGQRRAIAIGFFPGVAASQQTSGVDKFFASLVVNVGLAGIPTLASLLFEPFCDHHMYGMADLGLLGCRKYYVTKDPVRTTRTSERTVRCATLPLVGYAVLVNGVRVEPDKAGFIRLGGLKRGDKLTIEMISPPSFRADSRDNGRDLLGLTLEARCP